jgi:hypothetical protein
MTLNSGSFFLCRQDRTLLQILDRLGRVESLLASIHSDKVEAVTVMPPGASVPKDVTSTNDMSSASAMHGTPSFTRSAGSVSQPTGASANNIAILHQATTNPSEVPLEEDEQLAIPVQHTTAAHKLMWWPSIRKLIDEEFLANESYVMQEEEKRGPLRVHGRGESLDSPETMFEDMDDGDAGLVWDSGIGVLEEAERSWRHSEDSPMEDGLPEGSDYRKQHGGLPGSGLTTGGGLKLDRQTVLGLLNSYLANIHSLHPILDKATIAKITFMFVDRVSGARVTSPTTPYSTTVVGSTVGLGLGPGDGENSSMPSPGGLHRRNSTATKRKRSISGAGPLPSQGIGPTPQRIPRTLHSALVLLVLALGAICLHRKPVPGPLPPTSRSPGPGFRTATPPFRTNSPQFSGSTPPYHGYPQSQQHAHAGKSQRELRNIDVIPGLAYFGKAMEIMGVMAGGNELENVQICLLAGLYWGQLGRVLDSWKWINYACMGCQILVRM